MMKFTFMSLCFAFSLQLSSCSDSGSNEKKPKANNSQAPGTANGVVPTPDPALSPSPSISPTPSVSPIPQTADDSLASIDSICQSKTKDIVPVFPPVQIALPQTVPATCRSGIEFNDFRRSLTLNVTNDAVGSQTFNMEVDLATYQSPDPIRLVAIDAQGNEQIILSSCRLRTSDTKDPKNLNERPSSELIRSFRPILPLGTRKLLIDFSRAGSANYMKITGLCDFTIPASNSAHTRSTSN